MMGYDYIVCIYHILFVHLPVEPGYFHILALVNIAAVNIGAQLSAWVPTFNSFGHIHITGLERGSLFIYQLFAPFGDLRTCDCLLHTWLKWAGCCEAALKSADMDIFLSLLSCVLVLVEYGYLNIAKLFCGQMKNFPSSVIFPNLSGLRFLPWEGWTETRVTAWPSHSLFFV